MGSDWQFQLNVWRAGCRNVPLAVSLQRVLPIIAERLPLEQLLVRCIDPTHHAVESLAAERLGQGPAIPLRRTECQPDEIEALLAWRSAGISQCGDAEAIARACPGLLPASVSGSILVGPLMGESTLPGVIVLVAAPQHSFTAAHQRTLEEVLEPFGVAMANDARMRELAGFREALEADRRSLLSRLERHDMSESIIGARTGLREVMKQVDLVAVSDAPVLILGETGSGKEVVARTIHERSPRRSGPFLRVNCGAIPSELIDSELFGHERGSFTGAVNARIGWFERADGGTLFLDEIGELPLAAQVRLLRILQDGSFQRVGGDKQLHVDVRVVTATHRDLREMTVEGRFREDLWYRIAVFPIRLPALRERPEDIAALAAHFSQRACKRLGGLPLTPTAEQIECLIAYSWPGNVRELAAVIERAVILGNCKSLEVQQALGAVPLRTPTSTLPLGRERLLEIEPLATLDEAMARHIEKALTQARGRIEGPEGAAAMLGINPHTLRARMRKLGIDWSRFRGASALRAG